MGEVPVRAEGVPAEVAQTVPSTHPKPLCGKCTPLWLDAKGRCFRQAKHQLTPACDEASIAANSS